MSESLSAYFVKCGAPLNVVLRGNLTADFSYENDPELAVTSTGEVAQNSPLVTASASCGGLVTSSSREVQTLEDAKLDATEFVMEFHCQDRIRRIRGKLGQFQFKLEANKAYRVSYTFKGANLRPQDVGA